MSNNQLFENRVIKVVEEQLDNYLFEQECKRTLIEYGIYEYFKLDEGLNLDTSKEAQIMKTTVKRLGVLIPILIKNLVKYGAKKSVTATIKAFKAARKFDKNNDRILRDLFYALVFLTIGFVGNGVLDKVNEKPIEDGAHIVYNSEENKMNVLDADNNVVLEVVEPEIEDEAPIVKDVETVIDKNSDEDNMAIETPNTKHNNSVIDNSGWNGTSIRLLHKGEVKKLVYEPSEKIIEGMLEVENFVDHIYDAGDPRHKLTQKEMLDPKRDITAMYGHALTAQERKTWKVNRKFTKEEGKKVFMNDLKGHVNTVNNKLKQLPYANVVQFSDNFVDALIDMTFNIGPGKLYGNDSRKPTEFWRCMNNIRVGANGKYIKQDVDYALSKINTTMTGTSKQRGLKYRRRHEYLLGSSAPDKINPEWYHMIAPEYRK